MAVLGDLLTTGYVKCDKKIGYKSLTSYYYFVHHKSKFTDM
jgi:hypothetical protein